MTKRVPWSVSLGTQSGTVPHRQCDGVRVSRLPLKDRTGTLSLPDILDAGERLWGLFPGSSAHRPVLGSATASPGTPSVMSPTCTPPLAGFVFQQQDAVGNMSPDGQ